MIVQYGGARTPMFLPISLAAMIVPHHAEKDGHPMPLSVHQNPSADSPFVAKYQNSYFRGSYIRFDFLKSSSYRKHLDHENTNNENAIMLDSLLTYFQ